MVRNTPNYVGIEILGDRMDLDTLYLALHTVVGEELEYKYYEGPRIRVLSVCYDLRHALMGDSDVEFVGNGLDRDKMKRMALVAQEQNLYYKTRVIWPEILFVTAALNDFIRLYAKKQAKNAPLPLLDRRAFWDPSVATVRLFQAEIVKTLKDSVAEASFSRMVNLMNKDYPWMAGYATQYVDMLNIRHLELDADERQKSLPTIAKRLMERGKEYQKMLQDITTMAHKHNCSVENIELSLDYPTQIDW